MGEGRSSNKPAFNLNWDEYATHKAHVTGFRFSNQHCIFNKTDKKQLDENQKPC